MSAYTTTVGLEIHAELKTNSKMFCGCKNDPHAAAPNTHVCPVCMAHPGTLPTVNERAVELVLMVGKAIGGELADFSEFDRKNYFYPDIPKAYQISQYQYPLVKGGELAGVKITRIHLEEDTARSQHEGEKSLVDFNRAGVPLMELVTEPVIHSAEQAGAFARELQLLLRTIGASDANMERGEMRVEVNLSVSKTETFGTKVEVKNINSFKAAEAAIVFETKRHIETLEAGGTIIQETRGWDENKGKTFSQRIKETADDYRYFPDPDIPKVLRSDKSEWSDEALLAKLPETPAKKRVRYEALGLPSDQIEIIISDVAREAFFAAAVGTDSFEKLTKTLANYLITDVLAHLESGERTLNVAHAPAFRSLGALVLEGVINSRVAKDLLLEVVFDGADAKALAEARGLVQRSNADELIPIIDEILAANPAVVLEFKAGKEAVLQFLVGQGMKATKGSANPGMLADIIKQRISQ
jgi:aspartyl-tRNA(Asn)/glutamyl-tRNA(Gln) amidotransferase subunit B